MNSFGALVAEIFNFQNLAFYIEYNMGRFGQISLIVQVKVHSCACNESQWMAQDALVPTGTSLLLNRWHERFVPGSLCGVAGSNNNIWTDQVG